MASPKGFLIGASSASYQVECNNIHSDSGPRSSFTEPCGIACDHYQNLSYSY